MDVAHRCHLVAKQNVRKAEILMNLRARTKKEALQMI